MNACYVVKRLAPPRHNIRAARAVTAPHRAHSLDAALFWIRCQRYPRAAYWIEWRFQPARILASERRQAAAFTWREPDVTINGVALSAEESQAVCVVVARFRHELTNPAKRREVGSRLAEGYASSLERVAEQMRTTKAP